MKSARWLVALAFLAVVAPRALAQASPVTPAFNSEIKLSADASAAITETIAVNFTTPRHGIFRYIPYRYRLDNGDTITVPIDSVKVERNGQSEKFTKQTAQDKIVIKIGEANNEVSGDQTYTISYRVPAVVNFLASTDEFYWNITGNDWEWAWAKVTAAIEPPAGTTLALQNTKCFTGAAGSKQQDCIVTQAGPGVHIQSRDDTTVAAQFSKGVFAKPADYDRLRAGAVPWVIRHMKFVVLVNALAAIAGFLFLILWWSRHGRDPKSKAVTVVQYDPPDNASPGEVGVLMDERADLRDVTASLVNLAVHGYLIIHEAEEKKIIGSSKKFTFTRTGKNLAASLPEHERTLLVELFSTGNEVALDELKGIFISSLKKVKSALYRCVMDRKYFLANPDSVRGKYLLAAIGLVILGSLAFIWTWGLAAMGIILAVLSQFLPKRSPAGVEALWHARGFKLFLETAEKYRLKWQEKENIFEQYLPYAMVYGVADKWAKAFASLGIQQQQPGWYTGGSWNAFSTVLLWSSLNSATSAIGTSLAAMPGGAASGGSGFSGGFSGGGFGGGGGGSW